MLIGFVAGIVGFGLQILAIIAFVMILPHAGDVALGPYFAKDIMLWVFGAFLRYYSRHSVRGR